MSKLKSKIIVAYLPGLSCSGTAKKLNCGRSYVGRVIRDEKISRSRNARRFRDKKLCQRYSQIKSKLKRNYNLTVDDYNKMFEEQHGCCAICGVHQMNLNRRLAVDHSHESGLVRGLLCFKCNAALGLFNDSEKLLKKAITYLTI